MSACDRPRGGRQVRVSFSGGMNPASPRALRATLPLGRMVSHVMLPLFRPIRSHPSGGNCRALPRDQTAPLNGFRSHLAVLNESTGLWRRDEPSEKPWTRASPPPPQHKPADKIADDIGMTHDDLVAVLLLLGVGPVDVVAEGSLNASPVLVILLEYGTEVETRPDPCDRVITEQARGARNEGGGRGSVPK